MATIKRFLTKHADRHYSLHVNLSTFATELREGGKQLVPLAKLFCARRSCHPDRKEMQIHNEILECMTAPFPEIELHYTSCTVWIPLDDVEQDDVTGLWHE